MKWSRIHSADPVATAQEMLERGFHPDTMLVIQSGTEKQAHAIRKMIDDAGHRFPIMYHHLVIATTLPAKPRESFKHARKINPDVAKRMAELMQTLRELPPSKEKPVKVYEPDSVKYLIKYSHEGGENNFYAMDKNVTEFTSNFREAFMATRTQLDAMFNKVNRRCAGIKVPRQFTIDRVVHPTDDHLVWGDMYSTRYAIMDDAGNAYESDDDFQAAMRARDV